MNEIDYEREVSITLTLKEWYSVFGAPGDTQKAQRELRKALWPDVAMFNIVAWRSRRKVKEQLRKEVGP